MGGGGGGFFGPGSNPDQLAKEIREVQEETTAMELEPMVNELIGSLLGEYNDRDVKAVNTHLGVIRDALQKDIEGTVDVCFGGSVGKHTYVDGMSDIDTLVLLNNSELEGKSPPEVKKYFSDCLKQRLPNTAIREGKLAVTVTFKDAEIQLLPAVKAGSAFKISDAEGTSWTSVRPREFSDALTRANARTGGRLVPVVKLAKSIISRFPEDQQLSGYHVESLALKVFEGYDGRKTTKAMIQYFLQEAPKYVRNTMPDPTGQSAHVDEYLGSANSPKRQAVANSMVRTATRMGNADRAGDIEQWKEILE